MPPLPSTVLTPQIESPVIPKFTGTTFHYYDTEKKIPQKFIGEITHDLAGSGFRKNSAIGSLKY